jgi:glutaredoxin 2
MELELYFYNECGFSQRVLNTINNLGIGNKILKKNIRENTNYEKELIDLCGDEQVPTLKIDGKPMRGSEDINQFLVDHFLN